MTGRMPIEFATRKKSRVESVSGKSVSPRTPVHSPACECRVRSQLQPRVPLGTAQFPGKGTAGRVAHPFALQAADVYSNPNARRVGTPDKLHLQTSSIARLPPGKRVLALAQQSAVIPTLRPRSGHRIRSPGREPWVHEQKKYEPASAGERSPVRQDRCSATEHKRHE